MTNKRIEEISEGVYSEALSETVAVHYNPLVEEVSVNFVSARFLRVGDEYVSRLGGDTGLSLTAEELASRSYEINGKTITGTDVHLFARLLYDELYNEGGEGGPE